MKNIFVTPAIIVVLALLAWVWVTPQPPPTPSVGGMADISEKYVRTYAELLELNFRTAAKGAAGGGSEQDINAALKASNKAAFETSRNQWDIAIAGVLEGKWTSELAAQTYTDCADGFARIAEEK